MIVFSNEEVDVSLASYQWEYPTAQTVYLISCFVFMKVFANGLVSVN